MGIWRNICKDFIDGYAEIVKAMDALNDGEIEKDEFLAIAKKNINFGAMINAFFAETGLKLARATLHYDLAGNEVIKVG